MGTVAEYVEFEDIQLEVRDRVVVPVRFPDQGWGLGMRLMFGDVLSSSGH